MTRLLPGVLKAGLGTELVNKGFELYELSDDFLVMEYKGKHVATFTQHATVSSIRQEAETFLHNLDLQRHI